jgi:hypothetical protein
MQKYFFVFLFLFTGKLHAQSTKSIETDRPDQTETPYSVGKYKVQFENGFSVNKIDKYNNINNLVSLGRFGLSEKFELRMEASFDKWKGNVNVNLGLQPLELGFKANLFDEKEWVPKTSIIAHVAMPKMASKNYTSNYYAPNFRFTMQHTLNHKTSLSYNLGGEWSTDDKSFTPLYTLASGYDFNDKWYGYIELFGFFSKGTVAEHSFDGGLAYLVNDNLQLDISAGIGITKTAPKNYMSIGFSFRL